MFLVQLNSYCFLYYSNSTFVDSWLSLGDIFTCDNLLTKSGSQHWIFRAFSSEVYKDGTPYCRLLFPDERDLSHACAM